MAKKRRTKKQKAATRRMRAALKASRALGSRHRGATAIGKGQRSNLRRRRFGLDRLDEKSRRDYLVSK